MGVVRALNAEEVKAIFASTLESECFLPIIMPVSQRILIFIDITKETATRKTSAKA